MVHGGGESSMRFVMKTDEFPSGMVGGCVTHMGNLGRVAGFAGWCVGSVGRDRMSSGTAFG